MERITIAFLVVVFEEAIVMVIAPLEVPVAVTAQFVGSGFVAEATPE